MTDPETPFKLGNLLNVVNVQWAGGLLIFEFEVDVTLEGDVDEFVVNVRNFNTDVLDDILDVFSEQIKVAGKAGPQPAIEQTITPEMRGYYKVWSYPHYKETSGFVDTSFELDVDGFKAAYDEAARGFNTFFGVYPWFGVLGPDPMVELYDQDMSEQGFGIDFNTFVNRFFNTFGLYYPIQAFTDNLLAPAYAIFQTCGQYFSPVQQPYTTFNWRAIIFFNLTKIKSLHNNANPNNKLETLEFTINQADDYNFNRKFYTYKGLNKFPVSAENEPETWDLFYREDIKSDNNLSELSVSVDLKELTIEIEQELPPEE